VVFGGVTKIGPRPEDSLVQKKEDKRKRGKTKSPHGEGFGGDTQDHGSKKPGFESSQGAKQGDEKKKGGTKGRGIRSQLHMGGLQQHEAHKKAKPCGQERSM